MQGLSCRQILVRVQSWIDDWLVRGSIRHPSQNMLSHDHSFHRRHSVCMQPVNIKEGKERMIVGYVDDEREHIVCIQRMKAYPKSIPSHLAPHLNTTYQNINNTAIITLHPPTLF